jgi:molecular chaperone DnaK
MNQVIGIDLGTTNSEVAILRDGTPEIIPVDGQPIMPSCVGLDRGGQLLVGKSAKNQMVAAPEATILSIKRKMGTREKVTLGEKSFSPEEISSLILHKLKQAAESHLGQPVTQAVITVPAFFDDAQRKATRDAGVLAGLEVLRIINEPTAASLAYDANLEKDQTLLVYDLGGGTFDVSLVVVEHGVVEVKASQGDTHLGGDDFDQRLMEHVAKIFQKMSGADPLAELSARNRLWAAVESAKCKLSDAPFARIREEFFLGDHHLDVEIDRHDYEAMIRPLVRKTLDSVHQCLKDAQLLPRDIDRVLLVGGATYTPLVSEMIRTDLSLDPRHEINPDLIVALGAAIQAGSLAGQAAKSVLVDITPYTFGTDAMSVYEGDFRPDVFVPVIYRNSPLPVTKGEVFYTMDDQQAKVMVRIFQGEAPLSGDNIFIGEFMIEGLSPVPAGNEILLNLTLNLNGILEVTAAEKRTGLSKTVRMDTTRKGGINLEQARKNLSEFIEQDAASPEPADSGQAKDALLTEAKRLRQRARAILADLDDEDAAEVRDLIAKSKEAVGRGAFEALPALNESLSDMLFYLED